LTAVLGLFFLIVGGVSFMPFPFAGSIVMLVGLRIIWLGRNSESLEMLFFYGSIASIALLLA
jgi:hypothetical protein